MNIYDREKLGADLAKARNDKGLTQETLATRLGITRSQLSEYERGKVVSPTFDVLLGAAAELDAEFAVAGYRLTKHTPRRPQAKAAGKEKQLTFSFYKGRTPKDATIHVTTLRTSVVIKASVAAGEA